MHHAFEQLHLAYGVLDSSAVVFSAAQNVWLISQIDRTNENIKLFGNLLTIFLLFKGIRRFSLVERR